MSDTKGNDKIYEQLRGYFPAEYDLTPDELEKEIELENKKREIALGMMRTHLTEEKPSEPEPETEPEASVIITKNFEEEAIEAASAPVTEYDFINILSENEFVIGEEELDIPDNGEESADVTLDEEIFEEYASSIKDDDEIIVLPDDVSLDGYSENDNFGILEESSAEAAPEGGELSAAEKSMRKTVNWFFDFLEVFSICIACVIVVFALLFRLTRVSGESMENTLYSGEYLVVSDLFYEPECGDIVVLQNTSLEHAQLREPLVKRVIAVGGESVDITKNGIVSVTDADGNVTVLEQSYIKPETYSSFTGHYEVPEGHVFVMGDNRNHSTDSRSPLVGVVDERCIFGRAIIRLLPIAEFTVFENPYKN